MSFENDSDVLRPYKEGFTEWLLEADLPHTTPEPVTVFEDYGIVVPHALISEARARGRHPARNPQEARNLLETAMETGATVIPFGRGSD